MRGRLFRYYESKKPFNHFPCISPLCVACAGLSHKIPKKYIEFPVLNMADCERFKDYE